MASAATPKNPLLVLVAVCTYLSQFRVESFSLHQSYSSTAARGAVATTIKSQQIRHSSSSLFMSDAALSLSGQEGR